MELLTSLLAQVMALYEKAGLAYFARKRKDGAANQSMAIAE